MFASPAQSTHLRNPPIVPSICTHAQSARRTQLATKMALLATANLGSRAISAVCDAC